MMLASSNRPYSRIVEEASSIALIEVEEVNPNFVESYENSNFHKSSVLVQAIGFTGLGMVHAHDIAHFASQ